MAHLEKEGLLSRWSRLKREATAKDAERGKPSPAPATASPGAGTDDIETRREATNETLPELQLPSLDSLTPDSDFQAFMDPRVEDGVRRAALKTLFRSPGFNVTDGLDEYAGDYTKLETLAPAMVAALRHTQRTLFGKHGESGDNGSARSDGVHSGTVHAGAIEPIDEDRSLATCSEERRSHAQQDGKDHGAGEPAGRRGAGEPAGRRCAGEPAGKRREGVDTTIALEDSAGVKAGERSNPKNDGQAESNGNA